jgi:hypothetical protein
MLKGVAQSVQLAQGMGVETTLRVQNAATPVVIDDSQLSFSLPSVSRKKVTRAHPSGRQTPSALPRPADCVAARSEARAP